MKPIDEYAEQANREVGRYYGQRMSFTEQHRPYVRCQDWFKAHWQRFPRTSPDGGKTIDNLAQAQPLKSTGTIGRKTEVKQTGEFCREDGCGGLLVRTGSCMTCQSCRGRIRG